jgi:hypothetical protein
MNYVISKQGKPRLIYQGYLFFKEKETVVKVIWRCTEYRKQKCKARLHSTGTETISEIGEHNHAADAVYIEKEMAICQIREQAVNTNETAQKIVSDVSVNMTADVAAMMPQQRSIKRCVRRYREAESTHPANPKSLEDLVVSIPYTVTSSDEPFLLYDGGDTQEPQERMLIFSTERNLKILKDSQHWFMDGTFKACPTLFHQMYTVHASFNKAIIPLVYCLLPGKTTAIYKNLFEQMHILRSGLQPLSVMIDFEQAAITAINTAFGDATKIRACYFHFLQCIFRKVCFYGLKKKYNTEKEFAGKIKMLAALSFVPINQVQTLYDSLVTRLFEAGEPEVENFLSSFEDEFIGRTGRNRLRVRKPGRFPIEIWNNYDAVLNDWLKTNNTIEGWHHGFHFLLKCANPTIWMWIDAIKLEQSRNEMLMNQLSSATATVSRKQKYVSLQANLKTLVSRFTAEADLEAMLEYLKSISHNITI